MNRKFYHTAMAVIHLAGAGAGAYFFARHGNQGYIIAGAAASVTIYFSLVFVVEARRAFASFSGPGEDHIELHMKNGVVVKGQETKVSPDKESVALIERNSVAHVVKTSEIKRVVVFTDGVERWVSVRDLVDYSEET